MPEVNRQQFLKANPNQMALPGMEEHSHPGARALSQGFHFTVGHWGSDGNYGEIGAVHEDWGDQNVAELNWRQKNHSGPKGEITWVHTNPEHQGQGLATALYGIGRTMARVKPKHSTDRSDEGEAWAPKASAKYGGRVPKRRNEPD